MVVASGACDSRSPEIGKLFIDPGVQIFDVAWTANDTIYYLRIGAAESEGTPELAVADHGSSHAVHPLNMPCPDAEFGSLERLPDSRLGAHIFCDNGDAPDTHYSVAVGPDDKVEILARPAFPAEILWDSDLRSGWIHSFDDHGCSGIARYAGGAVDGHGDGSPAGALGWSIRPAPTLTAPAGICVFDGSFALPKRAGQNLFFFALPAFGRRTLPG